jgi:hypothetical protein
MINAENYLKKAKENSRAVFADAKGSVSLTSFINFWIYLDYVGRVTNESCNSKLLVELNTQKKLHPSQTSNQLGQLLLKIGTNLCVGIDKLNEKVCQLEQPLHAYKDWKGDGMVSYRMTFSKGNLV